MCLLTVGFGAFVDKTVLPYTNTNKKKLLRPCDDDSEKCQPAFGYRHVLNLTPREQEFKESVTNQFISGNLDSPEGGLDAMMQAAVCGVRIVPGAVGAGQRSETWQNHIKYNLWWTYTSLHWVSKQVCWVLFNRNYFFYFLVNLKRPFIALFWFM